MKKALFDRCSVPCGSELNRRAALCEECMSETCVFNPEGICVFPIFYGRKAVVTDDGCHDWIYDEKGNN